jgi:hypothetical protein
MDINKKISCSNIFLCHKLKCRVSFVQLKPILDIFLLGSSLSSCSEHSLKLLLLLNATCLLKYVLNCEQHFSCFGLDYPTPVLIVTGLARVAAPLDRTIY